MTPSRTTFLADINVTPLIDVMLVPLIVFMIPADRRALEVALSSFPEVDLSPRLGSEARIAGWPPYGP